MNLGRGALLKISSNRGTNKGVYIKYNSKGRPSKSPQILDYLTLAPNRLS